MSFGDSTERVLVRNSAAEDAPPYAVAEISGAESNAGESVLVVRKPTGSGQIVAIGAAGVAAGKYGYAFRGSGCVALYSGSTPSVGDTLEATSGAWTLSASGGGAGAEVLGDLRSSPNRVRVLIGGGTTGPPGPSGSSDEHGFARLNGALSGGSTATIDDYQAVEGAQPGSPLTSASNPLTLSGSDNDIVAVAKRSGTWEVRRVFASGGKLWPCWVTDGCSAASRSGGNLTAQTVEVYRDTLGVGAANRVAGTTPETAYWDDPSSGITITAGKSRRGYVVETALGTLDLLWVGCEQIDWAPS